MQILNNSDWAAPLQQGLKYTIQGADPQKTVVVNICGADAADPAIKVPADYPNPNHYLCTLAPLGVKRLAGQSSYTVNAAPYFRHLANVQPLPANAAAPTAVWGRAIVGGLLVDGTLTDFTWLYTVGSQMRGLFLPLSDAAPRRTLAVGERCEASLAMWPDNVASFEARTETGKVLMITTFKSTARGIAACPFTLDESVGSDKRVELWVSTPPGGRHLAAAFDVVEANPRGVRLAWQNPFGGVDYHTFEPAVGEQLVVEKSLALADDGWQAYSCTTESQTALQSGVENALTLRHLAEVLSSPRVWICKGDGTFTRVDVLTRSSAIALSCPGRLKFTIRNAAKTLVL